MLACIPCDGIVEVRSSTLLFSTTLSNRLDGILKGGYEAVGALLAHLEGFQPFPRDAEVLLKLRRLPLPLPPIAGRTKNAKVAFIEGKIGALMQGLDMVNVHCCAVTGRATAKLACAALLAKNLISYTLPPNAGIKRLIAFLSFGFNTPCRLLRLGWEWIRFCSFQGELALQLLRLPASLSKSAFLSLMRINADFAHRQNVSYVLGYNNLFFNNFYFNVQVVELTGGEPI